MHVQTCILSCVWHVLEGFLQALGIPSAILTNRIRRELLARRSALGRPPSSPLHPHHHGHAAPPRHPKRSAPSAGGTTAAADSAAVSRAARRERDRMRANLAHHHQQHEAGAAVVGSRARGERTRAVLRDQAARCTVQ